MWRRGEARAGPACSKTLCNTTNEPWLFHMCPFVSPTHASRHDLASLRGYCLECMMHLLVAPGCTRQPDEPNIEQLDWDALR